VKKLFLNFKLFIAIFSIIIIFLYVVIKSGPFSLSEITTTRVELKSIDRELFGIGSVATKHFYKIGPTFSGKIMDLYKDVGDFVTTNESIAKMDPIDLNEKIIAQKAAILEAAALLEKAKKEANFANEQFERYEKLFKANAVSDEEFSYKKNDLVLSLASLKSAQEYLNRNKSELDVLSVQKKYLELKAPASGYIVSRKAEIGENVTSSDIIFEIIDPNDLWIDARFDQATTKELVRDLKAEVLLRSKKNSPITGQVYRVEPLADLITEELLAKITFDTTATVPPIGEIAEVKVFLPKTKEELTVPSASIRKFNEKVGLWRVDGDEIEFIEVKILDSNLDGLVQVFGEIKQGDEIVVYSKKEITPQSKIKIVKELGGFKK
jgi:HlyD family secretion protein